jgi:hypothetical protein
VELDGIGRLNTGGDANPAGDELLAFTVKACDGGPAGSGMDYFAMIVPGHDYARGDPPNSGDVVKSGSAPPPPPGTGNLTVTTSTSGADIDPDGYTVTIDGTDPRAISTSGSVTYAGVSAASHTVALSGVASNCAVSGGSTQTTTVPAGGTATAAFSVSCSVLPPPTNQAPVVNAGPDETVLLGLLYTLTVSFGDADGPEPWSYRIDWGDGSSTSGARSAPGTFTTGHNYYTLLPRSFTIRVTVTDGSGASGADTKVITVGLL